MDRRTLLVGLGTLPIASAGCLAGDLGNPNSDRNDDTGTDDERNIGTKGAESVVARFDGEPSRPECENESETIEIEFDDETREFETAETVPYPDPPTAFARDEIVDYVETFENAYVTHDTLCDRHGSGRILRVGHSVRTSETFDWYDDVTVVFLHRAGGAVSGSDGEGNVWEAELPFEGVVYAVDESGAARVDFDEVHTVERDEFESNAPDPLETGELVAAFE